MLTVNSQNNVPIRLTEERWPAMGVDVGDGMVLRYDEAHRALVGLTVIGLRAKLQQELNPTPA